MLRKRRRAADEALDPDTVPLSDAYRYEVARAWPSWRDRWDFWSRPDVPARLRSGTEPDPRSLLRTRPDVGAYSRKLEQWARDRMEWLEEAAHG
jgi:hypothetical protein